MQFCQRLCIIAVLCLALFAKAGRVRMLQDGSTCVEIDIEHLDVLFPDVVSPSFRQACLDTFKILYPSIIARQYRSRYEADPSQYGTFDWSRVSVKIRSLTGPATAEQRRPGRVLRLQSAGLQPDILTFDTWQSSFFIEAGKLYPLDFPHDGYFTALSDRERAFLFPQSQMTALQRTSASGVRHVWALPLGMDTARFIFYRKDILQRYGIPEPSLDWTWDDLLDACRAATHPEDGVYGFCFNIHNDESRDWLPFLWMTGTKAMRYDETTNAWLVTYGEPSGVPALDFYVRLVAEHWRDEAGHERYGYATKDPNGTELWRNGRVAFQLLPLNAELANYVSPKLIGCVPVPFGPVLNDGTRLRVSDKNARLAGLSSTISHPAVRDAAWELLRFIQSEEFAVQTMVDESLSKFVNPDYLERFGLTDAASFNSGWRTRIFREAIHSARPELHGRHCPHVYEGMAQMLRQAESMAKNGLLPLNERTEYENAQNGSRGAMKKRNEILAELMAQSMTETIRMARQYEDDRATPHQRMAAWLAIGGFALLMLWAAMDSRRNRRHMGVSAIGFEKAWNRHGWPVIWGILPAVLTCLLWYYFPLVYGIVSGFHLENPGVLHRGDVIDHIGRLLWTPAWLDSLLVSCRYVFLMTFLTFLPPLCIAVALSIIPKGKRLLLLLFFLPSAITCGYITPIFKMLFRSDDTGKFNVLLMHIPAVVYMIVALAVFAIGVFLARRLFQHTNVVLSFFSLGGSALIALFFLKFVWKVLKDDSRDWQGTFFTPWVISFYIVLIAALICFLILAVYFLRKGVVLPMVICLALVIITSSFFVGCYLTTGSWSRPFHWALRFFHAYNTPYAWLESPDTALVFCAWPYVWLAMGPSCLIYIAAMQNIPDDLYEGASLDGATAIDKMLFVVFSNLRLLFVIQLLSILVLSWTKSGFINAFTGGGYGTRVADLQLDYQVDAIMNPGSATAMAIANTVILLGIVICFFCGTRKHRPRVL